MSWKKIFHSTEEEKLGDEKEKLAFIILIITRGCKTFITIDIRNNGKASKTKFPILPISILYYCLRPHII